MKTIVNNPSDLITLKEFKNLHKNRKSLTPYEKYKIRTKLKNSTEENILIHLYTKFLHFGMIEFNQRRFDIQVGAGSYSDITITRTLKKLKKMGYFTSEFKTVKGKQYKRLHFNINLKIMNEFLTVGEDLKPENFSNLIENLRREYETVEENPYTNKTNPTKEPVLSDSKDFKSSDELEPTKKETIQPEPPKEATEPINVVQWMTFENNNVNNDKIELFIKHLDNPKVKAMLKDLNVSTDDIRYYYSGGYKRGLKKDKDNIKDSLDIIHNQILQPLEGKSIIF